MIVFRSFLVFLVVKFRAACSVGGIFGLCLALGLMLGLVPGCDRSKSAPAPDEDQARQDDALVILASDDLKNLSYLQPGIEAATGRKVRFEYSRVVDMVDRVNAPDAAQQFDMVWPTSHVYLQDLAAGKIIVSDSILRSPLVLGLKHERAEELGWDKHAPSWAEIAQVARREEGLNLGMANPAGSEVGLLELLSATAAFGAQHEPLDVADLDNPKLKNFYAAAKLLGGGGIWLSDVYSKEEDRLDGIITYESSVLALNAVPDALDDPLAVVHIRDGSIHADFPLMLVNPARRREYDKAVAWLRRKAVQEDLMEKTFRRPVNSQVALSAPLSHDRPEQLVAPAKPAMLEPMIREFGDKVRLPAHSYFLLDVSGSMAEDGRIDQLKSALGVLVGSNQTTLAGRLARIPQREKLDLLSFDSKLQSEVSLDFSAPNYAAATEQFQQYVDSLQPKGGTATYDALQAAYQRALKDRKKQPGYRAVIVLITDGHNASGQNLEAFRDWLQSLPDTSQDIRVFPVLFGDVEDQDMKEVAALTHGRVFNATGVGLDRMLERVRAYQ